MGKRTIGALALIASMFVAPAMAQDLTEEQSGEATVFALSNSIFVLYHEIGHLLVGEFALPVLGKEEDAADILASVRLLGRETPDADQILVDAADGWRLMENAKAGENYEEADFYDEHSLDIQRSFQVVCLMVGADPGAFGEIATEYTMDPERQERCAFDYQQAMGAWDGLLEPHVKTATAGEKISVSYEPASENYAGIADFLMSEKFLENAAEDISRSYVLPRPLKFVGMECGEENAFYAPEEAQITFCYEMFAMFFDLMADELLAPAT